MYVCVLVLLLIVSIWFEQFDMNFETQLSSVFESRSFVVLVILCNLFVFLWFICS